MSQVVTASISAPTMVLNKDPDACPPPAGKTGPLLGGMVLGAFLVVFLALAYLWIKRWQAKRLAGGSKDLGMSDAPKNGYPHISAPRPLESILSHPRERQNWHSSMANLLPGRRFHRDDPTPVTYNPGPPPPPPTGHSSPYSSPTQASDFFENAFPIDHPARNPSTRHAIPLQTARRNMHRNLSRHVVLVSPEEERRSQAASVSFTSSPRSGRYISPPTSRDTSLDESSSGRWSEISLEEELKRAESHDRRYPERI